MLIHLYRERQQSATNASVSAMRNRIMSKKTFTFSSHGDCSLVSQIDINQHLTIINAKLHHKRRHTAVWGSLVEDLNCTGVLERLCLSNDDSCDVNNNRVSSYKEDRKGSPTREGIVTHRPSGEASRYTRWSWRVANG